MWSVSNFAISQREKKDKIFYYLFWPLTSKNKPQNFCKIVSI